MKKIFIATLILGLLILDWAALDDITTGNEPSYLGEYLIVFISFTILGYLFAKSSHQKAFNFQKRVTRNSFLKRYHLHHALTGLLLLLIGLLVNPFWLGVIISGFGLGLFLHDLWAEGLHFVTTEK